MKWYNAEYYTLAKCTLYSEVLSHKHLCANEALKFIK